MSDLPKQLGRRIYRFRKQSGMTQAALAERARISNEFMSAIERGAKLPSLPTLERVADGLKVNLKDLVNFDRESFRRLELLSREAMEVATMVEEAPREERRVITKIVKILVGSRSS